ncbi:hypothetical protein AAHA92_34001 [Salvia divinorum]|uniref:Uncharacterized protein n=1 Tax=Salvia divinorum TaxID=28513 RepID=A0ABD1FHL0_SALDI
MFEFLYRRELATTVGNCRWWWPHPRSLISSHALRVLSVAKFWILVVVFSAPTPRASSLRMSPGAVVGLPLEPPPLLGIFPSPSSRAVRRLFCRRRLLAAGAALKQTVVLGHTTPNCRDQIEQPKLLS